MNFKKEGSPQITPHDPEHSGSRRDPEERSTGHDDAAREKSFDKTLADSFPTSDPPSSIPDPEGPGSGGKSSGTSGNELFADLKPGSWAALSIDGTQVVGKGATQDEAAKDAKKHHESQIQLIQVPLRSTGLAS